MEKQGKTLHCKGHIASITLLVSIMFIFFMPIISAWEFDNRLYYEKNDMKVSIENAFGLGETLGTMELKSHSSVDEVLQFGYDVEEVVMYYDNVDLYGESLGDVIFTNERTGKEIEKDYYFVEWSKLDVPNYVRSCEISYMENGTKIETCGTIQDGTKQIDGWVKLKENIIPNRNTRIGIKTYVGKDDYIDAIWTIAGKKIAKHSSWTASLNVDLVAVYDFNEGSGGVVNEKVDGIYDGIMHNMENSTDWKTGGDCRLDGCLEFGGTDERVSLPVGLSSYTSTMPIGDKSWCNWVFDEDVSVEQHFFTHGATGQRPYWTTSIGVNDHRVAVYDADATQFTAVSTGVGNDFWMLLCATWDAGNTNITIYTNGTWQSSEIWADVDDLSALSSVPLSIGARRVVDSFDAFFTGRLDDMFLWNRTLSSAEMSDLWNGGLGIAYIPPAPNLPPNVTLNDPTNNTIFTANEVSLNCTGWDDINLVNNSLVLDGIVNETNTPANNTLTNFDKTVSSGSHNWTCRAADNNSEVTTAGIRLFSIDTIDPIITISSPTNTTYITNLPVEDNVSTSFNWTTVDINLDKCWYSMDEGVTNTTITCDDNVTIYTTYGTKTFTAWGNDTSGRFSVGRVVATLDYFALINSIDYTQDVYETEAITHSINITANSSLTSANLHFNGTRYTGVQSGTIWNYTFQVPTTTGNATIIWELTYAGNTYNTTTNYQTINDIQLGLCNATLTVPYTNISFKNEETLANMNATIDASTWNYWLGDGTYTKSITYSSSTNYSDYRFCLNPGNKTLYNNRTIQYSLTGFPQRRYTSLADLTNVSTNTTLYLLASADGIYVTFQTINTAQQAVPDVEVNASRTISGSTVIVAQGVTDSAGLVTFWLNPNYLHSFTFDSDSYDTYTLSLTPTQSSYTVNLGGTASDDVTNYHQGILVRILPVQDFLTNNTEYDFILNLTSDYWEVSVFGFSLYYGNATLIGAVNASTNGGNITIQSVNVSGDSIYLTYFYIANGTTINSEQARWWGLEATIGVDYSITKFFENFGTHLDSGLFGATDFTRLILSLLIIVMVVGGVSYNFGIRSEATIGALLFGLIFILDVGLEFIPSLTIGGFTPIPHFLTFATALILFAFLIKEARS